MLVHRAHDLTKEEIKTISLWIVESDDMFRIAIADLLNRAEGMQCRRAFRTCEEMLHFLQKGDVPELVLMDVSLPGLGGIEGVRRLKEVSPATDVLVLAVHEEDEKIFEAICAGAKGYLLKSTAGDELLSAVRGVIAGGAPMDARIASKVLHMFGRLALPHSDYGLTAREKEILLLMAEGMHEKAIAEKLFLSFFTVDTHLKNIYVKLHVHNGTGAVAKVLREKLL